MKNGFIKGLIILFCIMAWAVFLTGKGTAFWEFPVLMAYTLITALSVYAFSHKEKDIE